MYSNFMKTLLKSQGSYIGILQNDKLVLQESKNPDPFISKYTEKQNNK